MPDVLHLKPEDLDTLEKRGKYTVSVVGCGQKGVVYATTFAEAGFKVVCTDVDQSLIKRLAKGRSPFFERETESKLKSLVRTGQINATSELKNAVLQSDIIIMTISAKIDDKNSPDYSEVETSCKHAGAALRQGTLFIYAGTAGLGLTEGMIRETLENTSGLRVGEGFGLVYHPLIFSEGQSLPSLGNQELSIAAPDKTSLDAAAAMLGVITKKGVKQTLDVKTAELAALFTAAKLDGNRALANELAMLCESAGADFFETLKLLEPNVRETSFYPTIAEENDRNEAYLLLESAENLNSKLRLPTLARQVNENMVRHAVNLAQDTMRCCGKTLRRARIAVLGTPKQKSGTNALVKMLEAKGAKVTLYDPLFSNNELSDAPSELKVTLNEAVEGTDCIIILTGQDQFNRLNLKKLRAIMKTPAAIVDLIGIAEPQKVEKEGFTYRGLGRGAGKK